MAIDVSRVVDLDRYPIHVDGEARRQLVADVQKDVRSVGCAVIKQFVKPEAIPALVAEGDRVSHLGHRNFNRTNPYFTQLPADLPDTHPLRRFYDRSNAFVPADNFGEDSIIRAMYEWSSFAPFIQEVLEEPSFYRYADPLADVVINLAEEGNGFPWHFDTNNYTVTLAIQNAEHGGEFEFSPNLRTSTDENYDGVGRVLDGDQSLIHSLHLEPGDLQIFKGRYSLHRVTPLSGPTMRYVAIFSFTEMEVVVGSPERTKQLYGRVLTIQL
jgi:hypothetical protein